jgi:hypothetical protein
MVTVPVMDPVVVGANCRLSVAVWAGFRVSGKVIPDMLKAVPFTLPALIVSGAVPLEVSVTVCAAVVFSITLPKATLLAPRVSPGIHALSCNA